MRLHLLAAVAPLVLLAACASAGPGASARGGPSELASGVSPYGMFLAGEAALNDGKSGEAAHFFDQARMQSADDAMVSERAFTAALLSGDVDKAAALAPSGDGASEASKRLGKLVVADMVERDEGRILFTSSIASTMPGPFQAVYNASKSFVQSFALAIRNELKDSGISVTSLMPGATETEFFERAEMEDTEVGAGEKDDPAEVARQGFDALMADKERVVAGALKNKVQVAAGRVLPDSVKAEKHREMAEPGSAED